MIQTLTSAKCRLNDMRIDTWIQEHESEIRRHIVLVWGQQIEFMGKAVNLPNALFAFSFAPFCCCAVPGMFVGGIWAKKLNYSAKKRIADSARGSERAHQQHHFGLCDFWLINRGENKVRVSETVCSPTQHWRLEHATTSTPIQVPGEEMRKTREKATEIAAEWEWNFGHTVGMGERKEVECGSAPTGRRKCQIPILAHSIKRPRE